MTHSAESAAACGATFSHTWHGYLGGDGHVHVCDGVPPTQSPTEEPMHRWVEPHGDLTACGIRWWNGTRGEAEVTCPACVTPPGSSAP